MSQSAIRDFRLGAERLFACDIAVEPPKQQSLPWLLTIEGRGRTVFVTWDEVSGFAMPTDDPNVVEHIRNVDQALKRFVDIHASKQFAAAA